MSAEIILLVAWLATLLGVWWQWRSGADSQQRAATEIAQVRTERDAAQAQVQQLLRDNALQAQRLELQEHSLSALESKMSEQFENLANRIFDDKQSKFSAQSREALDISMQPLRRDLNEFRQRVEQVYKNENDQRGSLVGQIIELRSQTERIANDAAKLADALRGDNKAQGNWGEMVLERLLEDSGLSEGREYSTQASSRDSDGRLRYPDVVVHLPEGRDVVIDSKVTLTDYERYYHAEDELQRKTYLNQHLQSLRNHVRGLSLKEYQSLPGVNSLDFVLIFVPIEAAFILAIDNDADLIRDAYQRNIIIVSPSTLMVTLRTIKNLWRYADQNSNAVDIATKAGALYDQFVLFVEALEDVGKHLDKSREAYKTAHKRLSSGNGNLVRRVEQVKQLGAKAKKSLPASLVESSQANHQPPGAENDDE